MEIYTFQIYKLFLDLFLFFSQSLNIYEYKEITCNLSHKKE